MERFNLHPARLIGDTAYGSAEMLNWFRPRVVGIDSPFPCSTSPSAPDGTFSREDFTYNHASDTYLCPAGKALQHYRRALWFITPRTGVSKDNLIRYRASDARLPAMSAEAAMLSERTGPQGPALHP